MSFTRWTMTALAGVAVLAAPAFAAAAPKVTISEAWIREAPPSAEVMGGYLTLRNTSDHDLTIKGATSPLFHSVELHETYEEGGRMGMRPVRNLTIHKGESFALKPGGAHIMFMQPSRPIKVGEKVPVTFDFGKDGLLAIEMPVKNPRDVLRGTQAAPSAGHEGHEHHEHHHH